jgi:CheY-like chemotaxis protein
VLCSHFAEVKVSLPLLREMPKAPDSTGSTPKSVTSLPREADESIANLRARVVGLRASLCGFDVLSPDPVIRQTGKLLERSVTNFLKHWYGMQVVPLGQKANVIIANEADPTMIEKLVRQGTTNRKKPTILVLCPNSRFDRARPTTTSNVGFVAKPIGPLKLARALLQCLDGVPPANTPRLLESSPSGENSDLSQVFEEMSLSPHTGEMLDNTRMAADSDNARKAIESPTPNAAGDKHQEFPFPASLPTAQSMPEIKDTLQPLTDRPAAPASEILTNIENSAALPLSPSTATSSSLKSRPPPPRLLAENRKPQNYPRLLLVEDNNINLNLLRMYMRKRQYDIVDEAENGLEAVRKFTSAGGNGGGYDIVFMDISMPVLDGFGATREIRQFEKARGEGEGEGRKEGGKGKGPALIIALTGLASSKDQAEAAECGIDLFMTKPVALKEVGKLLDNWEANRGK